MLAQIEDGGCQTALDPLLNGRADLGHVVQAAGDNGIQMLGFFPVEAGALELVDLAADQGDLIGQDLERIFDARMRYR